MSVMPAQNTGLRNGSIRYSLYLSWDRSLSGSNFKRKTCRNPTGSGNTEASGNVILIHTLTFPDAFYSIIYIKFLFKSASVNLISDFSVSQQIFQVFRSPLSDLPVSTHTIHAEILPRLSPNALPGTTATFSSSRKRIANSSEVIPNSLILGKI